MKKKINEIIFIFNAISSYKILAPAIMDAEPNPKIATAKCLENTTLDPDFFRIGHTKARKSFSSSTFFPCSMSLHVYTIFIYIYVLTFQT